MRTIKITCATCDGTGRVRAIDDFGGWASEGCDDCASEGFIERAVIVSEEFPPVPSRQFDYRATFDGYEGGDPQGFGPTPDAAVAELLDQVEA